MRNADGLIRSFEASHYAFCMALPVRCSDLFPMVYHVAQLFRAEPEAGTSVLRNRCQVPRGKAFEKTHAINSATPRASNWDVRHVGVLTGDLCPVRHACQVVPGANRFLADVCTCTSANCAGHNRLGDISAGCWEWYCWWVDWFSCRCCCIALRPMVSLLACAPRQLVATTRTAGF